jgi:hypothetical protein
MKAGPGVDPGPYLQRGSGFLHLWTAARADSEPNTLLTG